LTKDGKYLSMSSSAQSVFERTMHAIGRPELIADVRFLENRVRGTNVEALDAIIGDWVIERTAAEAMAILVANEAAAMPVYSVADVVADEHVKSRASIATVDDRKLGKLRMQAPTPHLSRTPGEVRFPGPGLGEHNREVYAELLGKSERDLDTLRAAGII